MPATMLQRNIGNRICYAAPSQQRACPWRSSDEEPDSRAHRRHVGRRLDQLGVGAGCPGRKTIMAAERAITAAFGKETQPA
jgi:hypothetical protein